MFMYYSKKIRNTKISNLDPYEIFGSLYVTTVELTELTSWKPLITSWEPIIDKLGTNN